MAATSKVTIKVDGEIIKSTPGTSINLGLPVRDAVVSDQGTVDYRDTPTNSEVSVTMIHDAATDLIALGAKVGIQLNIETDTNVFWTISNAFVASVGALSNGEVEVTFIGPPAVRI